MDDFDLMLLSSLGRRSNETLHLLDTVKMLSRLSFSKFVNFRNLSVRPFLLNRSKAAELAIKFLDSDKAIDVATTAGPLLVTFQT